MTHLPKTNKKEQAITGFPPPPSSAGTASYGIRTGIPPEPLNSGKLPGDEAVRVLDRAVVAMLEEDDGEMRSNKFLRVIGCVNPEGRPPGDKKPADRMEARKQAHAFWLSWLCGSSKTEARTLVAEEHGCSTRTIGRRVKTYPDEAKRAFHTWYALMRPERAKAQKAADAIRAFMEKVTKTP